MGQERNPRRVGETEARAYSRMIRTSPQKLNLVAGLIRGLDANAALNELLFCRRRVAKDVRKVLESAIANAENNHELDVDRLVVAQATVGKSLVMRRFRARARGRAGRLAKPFSNLTVVVRERTAAKDAVRDEEDD